MSIRTLVVIEDTATGRRHVMEVAAEATITYDDPRDPWSPLDRFLPTPPHMLDLSGAILRHTVFDLSEDPSAAFVDRAEIEQSKPAIEDKH